MTKHFVAVWLNDQGVPAVFPAKGGSTSEKSSQSRLWLRQPEANAGAFSKRVMDNATLHPGIYAVYSFVNGEYRFQYQVLKDRPHHG
jgi:hypothetical protein